MYGGITQWSPDASQPSKVGNAAWVFDLDDRVWTHVWSKGMSAPGTLCCACPTGTTPEHPLSKASHLEQGQTTRMVTLASANLTPTACWLLFHP